MGLAWSDACTRSSSAHADRSGRVRLIVVGDGKMGRAVARLAEAGGHTVHAVVGRETNAEGALTPPRLKGVDVAVEFTRPDVAAANIERLVEAGVPVVTGTTGWHEQLPAITALIARRGGALLHAANFFLRAAGDIARRFAGRPEFDAFILEEHHAAKIDAPSGTARELQRRAADSDPARAFGITSVRAGATPGSHLVAWDGPFE